MESFSSAVATLDHLLSRYERFGVDLGLERMQSLLSALGNPHQQVPMLHVAGTNGKGSVCAYSAAVLAAAGYRVGRYTSPHLVSWCERITLNGTPIQPEVLVEILHQIEPVIDPNQPSPTLFEVVTAAAWVYFAQQQVEVAVIEVGLGGRLDATNVCDRPLVSVLTSISRDHWQRLGPTLADIASEKAGILKPGRPAVIGPLPPEAKAVVTARCRALACPTQWPEAATSAGMGRVTYAAPNHPAITYRLPFPGDHQRLNSALAIAALQSLCDQGWIIPDSAIVEGIEQTSWPGRLQWVHWIDPSGQPHLLLIDGAHNPAAAQVLRAYIDHPFPPRSEGQSTGSGRSQVTWLIGMLSTKDHRDIFQALLKPGDRLALMPVPGHLSADPEQLAQLAWQLCPGLETCQTFPTLAAALMATDFSPHRWTVLCGSLYLVGHFFATQATALAPVDVG